MLVLISLSHIYLRLMEVITLGKLTMPPSLIIPLLMDTVLVTSYNNL
jgi:hypothetical protein